MNMNPLSELQNGNADPLDLAAMAHIEEPVTTVPDNQVVQTGFQVLGRLDYPNEIEAYHALKDAGLTSAQILANFWRMCDAIGLRHLRGGLRHQVMN